MTKRTKVTETELAYLAGLWDGEGTFSVQKLKTGFGVRAAFCNTNQRLFKRVVKLLDKMTISPYKQIRQRRENWKPSFELSINRQNETCALLQGVLPYLSGKKAVAEIVLKFVNRRLALKGSVSIVRDSRGRIVTSKKGNTYTVDDKYEYELIRNLNKKGFYSNELLSSSIQRLQVTKVDAAYLAGILDGEGSFLIKKKTVDDKIALKPSCVIANCNTVLLNRCIQILNSLDITYYIRLATRKTGWAAGYNIEVERVRDILRLTKTVLPYLSGKKDIAKILRKFVQSRIELKNLLRNHRQMAYTENELDLFDQAKRLNERGLRLPAEQSVLKKFRELLETPNVKSRTISSRVPNLGKGSETISKESKLEAIAS